MASLGRLTNSIVSAVNENSLSLANINFDFSLVTVQAPPEYSQVGSSLAVRKRDNAENGTAHRTARKLGALFESIIPHTPLLVSAYGTRASQIIATPGLNPKGSTKHHGPFVDWVGADATSIWAAATSGSHCIAVHLLACMLVRAFEDPAVSTSLWVQLIEQRQKEIEEMSRTNFTSAQFATINAASQQFPRQELREWDASVRAWLLSADAAMILEHTQLQLIIKNTSIMVNGGNPSAYMDVMNTWRHAMVGLESLLAGEPQCVTNGGILLAISSWHLYPTLMVLGSQVKMLTIKDPLVPEAGVITIGIEKATSTNGSSMAEREHDGIYWSIALSHYRYYGLPVEVVGKPNERLRMDELHLVTLGSLLGSWEVSRKDPFPACRWMVTLWGRINEIPILSTRSSWLRLLAEAATCLLHAKDTNTPEARQRRTLFDFGHRRHKTFLAVRTRDDGGSVSGECFPWFGLRSGHLIDALSCESSDESAISYLRALASYGGIAPKKALITWISPIGGNKRCETHIYMSAVATNPYNESYPLFGEGSPNTLEDLPELESNDAPSAKRAKSCKGKEAAPRLGKRMFTSPRGKHDYWVGEFAADGKRRQTRVRHVKGYRDHRVGSTSHDEDSHIQYTVQGDMSPAESIDSTLWTPLGPQMGTATTRTMDSPIPRWIRRNPADGIFELQRPLDCGHKFVKRQENSITVASKGSIPSGGMEHSAANPLLFDTRLNTDQEYFHLWFRDLSSSEKQEFNDRVLRLRRCTTSLMPLEESVKRLKLIKSPRLLWQYFEGPDPYEPDTFIKAFLNLILHERSMCQTTLRPLRNLAFATSVYETLEGATISTRIVDTGLANAKWAIEESCPAPTISHILSCIGMMETGVVNLDLGAMTNVLGLCSGNSMFVLSRLLVDPSARLKQSVTRLVGNVGRPGVSLLVPPAVGPLIRPLSSSYCAVSYAPFDGKWEDNFGETTLHLSFTKHEFPIDYGVSGIMDHQVFLVESVISVHDRGKWVADLDILSALKPDAMPLLPRIKNLAKSKCFHNDIIIAEAADNLTSLDTWEEILDAPPDIGIVRAHKNWAARLTVGAVLSHKQKSLMIEEYGFEKAEGLRSEQAVSGQRRIFAILEEVDHVCHVCVYQRVKQWRKKYAKDDSPIYLVA